MWGKDATGWAGARFRITRACGAWNVRSLAPTVFGCCRFRISQSKAKRERCVSISSGAVGGSVVQMDGVAWVQYNVQRMWC